MTYVILSSTVNPKSKPYYFFGWVSGMIFDYESQR
jgi:hypothetical protein